MQKQGGVTVTLCLWGGYAVQAVACGHEVHLCAMTLSTEEDVKGWG